MRRLKQLLPIIALALLGRLVVAGDEPVMYLWIDAEGVTTFSQSPPPQGQAEEVPVPRATEPATAPPPPEARSVIANERTNAQTLERNCMIGHRTLAALTANKNIYLIGEDGFYHKISAERLALEVQKAQAIIDANCIAAQD